MLISLLSVYAQMPPNDGPGHNDPRNGMGDNSGHPDRMGARPPHFRDGGFEGRSEFMIVEGNIVVGDAGITLSISATPNMTAMKGHPPMTELPSNTINVSLYELVEFEDSSIPGYDMNDTVVSVYYLNSSTLGDLVTSISGDSQNYTVSSNDGVFSMTVEANTSSVQSFKWSVEINYPFVSNTSKIAMLHDVITERTDGMQRGRMMAPPGTMHDGNHPESATHFDNRSLIVRDANIPMFFKWIDVAEVDGTNQSIEATASPGFFALSLPQGDSIFYDPSIGVENEVIENVYIFIAQILENTGSFMDAVFSPTIGALSVSFVLIVAVLLYINRRKFLSKTN